MQLKIIFMHFMYSCTKIESNIPKKFKLVLQTYLYESFSYSLDEYFELQKVKRIFTGSGPEFET
jgi:hypothetical protein